MDDDEDVIATGLDAGDRALVDDLAALGATEGKLTGFDRGKLRALAMKAQPGDRRRIEALLDRITPEPTRAEKPVKDAAAAAAAWARGVARAEKVGATVRAQQEAENRMFGKGGRNG